MELQFQGNRENAQDIIRELEETPEPEESYEEIMVAVHPGFCLTNQKYTDVDNLRREVYFQHTLHMHRDMEEAHSQGVPVDVVYRRHEGSEARKYLGEHSEQVDNFIEGDYGTGFVTERKGQRSLAETVRKVEEGGKIDLYGEINGLCYTQFEDLMREVSRQMEKEIEVNSERPFPEKPLDRTQGVLHWEHDVPTYLKALEFKSAYR